MRMTATTTRKTFQKACPLMFTFLYLPFSFWQAMMEPTKVTMPMKMPISMNTIWMVDSAIW